MTTTARKVFVVPLSEWATADPDAVHLRNIAAMRRSLDSQGTRYRDVLHVGIEPNADGASVNLVYEVTIPTPGVNAYGFPIEE